MTPTQLSDKIISQMQEAELTPDQMLELIALVRRKIEKKAVEEALNKPNKQITLEL